MKFFLKFIMAIAVVSVTTTSCVSNYVVANNNAYKYPTTSEFLLVKNMKGPNAEKYNDSKLIAEKKLVVTKVITKEDISEVNTFTSNLLTEAKTYLGTPYLYGGTTRRGIDCSSFVQHVFKASDISLPRTSIMQSQKGSIIPRKDLEKGDLIFFAHSPKSRISHVGIVESVSETGEVFFIHASSSRGVTISSLEMPYWSKRFRTAKRVEQPYRDSIENIESVLVSK